MADPYSEREQGEEGLNRLMYVSGVIISALSVFIFSIPRINTWLCSEFQNACISGVPPIWPSLLLLPVGFVLIGYSFRKAQPAIKSSQGEVTLG